MSGADLDGGHEVQLETVDGRRDGLTSFSAAVGAADKASDGLTSLGVAVGVADEANGEVGYREWDRSLSGRLELVFELSQVVDKDCLREVPVTPEHGFV